MLHSVDQWQCPQCQTMNMEIRSKCRGCGTVKPAIIKELDMVDSTEFGYFTGKKRYQYYHRHWDGIDKPEYTDHHPIDIDDGLMLDMMHGGKERTNDPLLEAIKARYGEVVRALKGKIRQHLKEGLDANNGLLIDDKEEDWLEDMLREVEGPDTVEVQTVNEELPRQVPAKPQGGVAVNIHVSGSSQSGMDSVEDTIKKVIASEQAKGPMRHG